MPLLVRSPVARRRLAAGFKNAALAAQELQCSRIHLLEIEEGASTPSDGLLERMAGSYGCPVAALKREIKRTRRDWLERKLVALRSW